MNFLDRVEKTREINESHCRIVLCTNGRLNNLRPRVLRLPGREGGYAAKDYTERYGSPDRDAATDRKLA